MYDYRILLILFLVIILILFCKRETFIDGLKTKNDYWWENKEKEGSSPPKNLEDWNVLKDVECSTEINKYQEKNITDLKKHAFYNDPNIDKVLDFNQETELVGDHPIINFPLGEVETYEKNFQNPEDFKILTQSQQIPSIRMKAEPHNLKKLTIENSYGQNFRSFSEFYRYQTSKKIDQKNNTKIAIPTFRTGDKISENEVVKSLYDGGMNKFQILATDKPDDILKKQKAYHDLFGPVHHWQGESYNLVSRGYKTGKDYLINPKNEGEKHNPQTSSICKECPIATIQHYDFNVDSNPNLSSEEKSNRKGRYFVEKGGTYLNKETGKCDLCDYQNGCFSPEHNRFMYQEENGSCVNGKNRICKPCKSCPKGEEKIVTFCGEGGAGSDTVCQVCKKCAEDEYKVDGCNITDTIEDTKCAKKTDCLGEPNQGDIYEDPGPGRRTYEAHPGYSGSAPGIVTDLYGNQFELPNPYYGRDRTCFKCDDCPEGYINIGGCKGVNNTENSVCQRAINVESILKRDIQPPAGFYYDTEKVKAYIKELNDKMKADDDIIRENYKTAHSKEPYKYPLSNINKPEIMKYGDIPDISDAKLLEVGKTKCSVCNIKNQVFQDQNDPGCVGRLDTKCVPFTKCKPTDKIKIPGTATSDVVCGPCKCPEGQVGTEPVCDGTENVKNCVDNVICSEKKSGKGVTDIIGTEQKTDEKLFTYDKPSAYGDSTRPDKCKVCDKECPVGKFQIGECLPDRSNNIVCKDHSKCDPNTQYVIQPGTSTSDTICKCLDGYEWDKDEYGVEDRKLPCVKIKGLCHTNPCHPNAICYDNFDDEYNFIDYTCRCDINDNYIETEDQGKGPKGCIKISDKHAHNTADFDANRLSAPQISDYKDLLENKPRALSTLAHTRGINGSDVHGHFHNDLLKFHIHK